MNFLSLVFALSFQTLSFADIPNFLTVTEDKIYRGGRPTSESDLKDLKKINVRTVINLQGGDPNSPWFGKLAEWFEPGEDPRNVAIEEAMVKKMGINFWHAPMSSFEDMTKYENLLIDQTLMVMNSKRAQPVFIHCEHGKDRTGMMVALYRVKYEGWTIEDAYFEWINNGHGLLLILSDSLDEYFFKKAAHFTSGIKSASEKPSP